MGVPPHQQPSQDPFGENPYGARPPSGPPPIYSQQPSQGYPTQSYPQHHTSGSWPHTAPPRSSGAGRNPHLHWWIGGAVLTVLALVVVIVLVTVGGHDNPPARPSAAPIQSGAPAQSSGHAAAPTQSASAPSAGLSGYLLGEADISGRMKAAMVASSESGSAPLTLTVAPPNCSSAYAPATAAGYQGGHFSQLAVQGFRGPDGTPATGVIEAVAQFLDAGAAQDFYHQQFSAWGTCKYTRVTGTYSDGKTHVVKIAVPGDDGTTVTDNMFAIGSTGSAGCERAMTVKSVYVIDVRVCRGGDAGGNAGGYATSIAHAIQRNIT